MKILALDMSSTKIGVCYDGVQFRTSTLVGDVAQRCEGAQYAIEHCLRAYPDIDLVVIESPVGRFAKALIPQARVSGVVLAELSRRNLAWTEISPAQAKKALTGKGTATKPQMIAAAPAGCDEHQADAYGLWKAAQNVRVEVSE
jgi:Holliday junction resolvasome RuvABC endonuclease subunit